MQIRFKFEDYVEEIVVTVRANELIVGLPEKKEWRKEVARPKTLLEVFSEAEAAEEAAAAQVVEPKPVRKRKTKNSSLYRFDDWYSAYPRKTNRGQAEKAWQRLSPDDVLIDTMLVAVEIQKEQPDWKKDGGQFIPHPGTWLNNKRWLDEAVGVTQATEKAPYADKPWGAFIREGQPHEVLNLMAAVGLDDADAVLQALTDDGLEATCDWLWGMRTAK